jgi:hypothetical protein
VCFDGRQFTGKKEKIMKNTWLAGILIALFCAFWQLIMGLTGWYKDPVMMNVFWIVILIQIAGLIWGLRRTAMNGKGYWAQVGHGTLMSLIAGVILFLTSYLFTSVLYPDYFAEMKTFQENALRQAGKSPQEIKIAMETVAMTANSLVQGISALTGTLVTGLICSLVIAAFVRHKART